MRPRFVQRARGILPSRGLPTADIVSWFDRVGGESKGDAVPGALEEGA